MLAVRDLVKTYPGEPEPVSVLRGVSLDIGSGESVALVGESGCGKTTLMHLIAGLDAADSGSIRLGETEVTALDDDGRSALRRSRLGLVFQQYNLIASLNAGDNIRFQAQLSGRFDAEWTDHLSQALGLGDLLHRMPEQLSGGQQQRVAIARTLALRPELLLADEPTGNLDEAASDRVLSLCLDLSQDTDCAVLLVTHSDRLAAMLDRRVRLTAGQIADGEAK